MSKKQIMIVLIVANVLFGVGCIFLLLLLITRQDAGQVTPVATPSRIESDYADKAAQTSAHTTQMELNHTQQVQWKPRQTTKMQIDSIISQYDVIKSGRYREFIENYKQAIRKEPPYTADSTIGYTYIKLGDYEKAIKLSEENVQGSSYPAPADIYTLAWIYAKIGKYQEAIAVSKKTIILHPRYAKIWHVLGWLYARLGENDKAVDACNNALKLDPDSAWVHYGLGRIYAILGNHEKAVESYKQAIQLQSDFAEAYLFLGLTYAELGDQKNAIDSYRQAILFDRYYAETHFFLGIAYDESSEYKKAIESFERAIELYASTPGGSWHTKIRIHSLGIKSDMATLNCIKGVCHLRLGQESKASFAFKNAVDIDDSYAEAHYGLAIAYFLLDNKDAAVEEYEAVKALKGEEMAKPLFDIIH